MESEDKIKISSDLILTKLLIPGGLFISLLLLQDYNRVASKTFMEYILVNIVLLVLLIYIFTRPSIFCNSNHFYIKKINKEEIIIPLRNIKSVGKDFFTSLTTRGINFYSVEYTTIAKKSGKIKVQIDYNSENFATFIAQTKKVNPSVDIS